MPIVDYQVSEAVENSSIKDLERISEEVPCEECDIKSLREEVVKHFSEGIHNANNNLDILRNSSKEKTKKVAKTKTPITLASVSHPAFDISAMICKKY